MKYLTGYVTTLAGTREEVNEPEDPSRPSPGVTADDPSPGRGRLPSGSLTSPAAGTQETE